MKPKVALRAADHVRLCVAGAKAALVRRRLRPEAGEQKLHIDEVKAALTSVQVCQNDTTIKCRELKKWF